nr:unnamed protein product [Haemonchus contortus]
MLLLNLAIDRLLSLTTSYNVLTNYYTKMYITVQLLPGCIYGGGITVMAFLMRVADRNVICTMAAPLLPPLVGICAQIGTILCVLLIICYSLFGFFIRKLRLKGMRKDDGDTLSKNTLPFPSPLRSAIKPMARES